MSPTMDVSPERELFDVPLAIRMVGLKPQQSVTLRARVTDFFQVVWESMARFVAGNDGVLDLDKDAPVSGSYSGPDAMGLVWSMTPVGCENRYASPFLAEPCTITFEALIEGKDWIRVNDQGATKLDGVWAGGDVTRLDLVTTAIGHGRRAAEAIDHKFAGTEADDAKMELVRTDRMRLDHYEKVDRQEPTALGVDERLGGVETEVNKGLTADQVLAESQRCMSCGYCFDCEKCWLYCQDQAINKPMEKGVLYSFKLENCTGCKKCAEECPCGFIDML